ncbi:MAG: rod shape-determining protein MreC [Armatimonadota bacterium]
MLARLHTERSRTALLFAALTVCALALNLWQLGARRAGRSLWFESAICAVSSPLQRALLGSSRFLENEWLAVTGASRLRDRNARLEARVAELERQLSQTTEARLSGARARRLLSEAGTSKRRLARVIALGEGGWSELITLDRGSADGVHQRDVAIAAAGVVGQVISVAPHSSRLLPLTAPASAISARLQRSREAGVLKGIGQWRCELRYLDPQADVRPGDAVITSGLGGTFPAGLRVGQVVRLLKDPETPGKAAEVRPAARVERIEEVLLLPAAR